MPMAELRKMLENMNFQNVQTYIQSGNVVFNAPENNKGFLEEKISVGIQEVFGFEVPVLVKSRRDIENLLKENPYTDPEALENNHTYFVLLKNKPDEEHVKAFEKDTFENEQFFITSNCVYLLCQRGYGKAKLNNNLIERKLKVEATTRNYRTMAKLLEMTRK